MSRSSIPQPASLSPHPGPLPEHQAVPGGARSSSRTASVASEAAGGRPGGSAAYRPRPRDGDRLMKALVDAFESVTERSARAGDPRSVHLGDGPRLRWDEHALDESRR